jgi:protein ImuB
MQWACLFLPQLALDLAARTLSDPTAPLLLVHGASNRRSVYAVNATAAAHGLKPGMSLAAAEALLHGFQARPYQPEQETAARELLAALLYRFSAQVSLDLPAAVVFEIARSERLWGTWPRLLQRLRAVLQDLGYQHRLVAAPNPFAAWALAHQHLSLGIDAQHLSTALKSLPLTSCGFDSKALATFKALGLHELRQVLALPRAGLQKRLGKGFCEALASLLGERPPLLHYYQPKEHFSAQLSFEYAVRETTALLFPLQRLTQDLAAFLAARVALVQRLELKLMHAREVHTEVCLSLAEPTRAAERFFAVLRERLSQHRLPAEVFGLQLQALPIATTATPSGDLFQASSTCESYVGLLERLQARLGERALVQLNAAPHHRPEAAHQERPAMLSAAQTTRTRPMPATERMATERALARSGQTDERALAHSGQTDERALAHSGQTDERALANSQQSPSQHTKPLRPSWLLEHPRAFQRQEFVILAGPERIESGWWETDSIAPENAQSADHRRDYYVVETHSGQRAWIFCPAGHAAGTPTTNDWPWMLHGWFA